MKIKTGIVGLDKMLHGGFIQGRNILLSGPCGTGKSTLAMQFIHSGAKNGEPGLYVTMEESKDKLYDDMLKYGFDLKKMEKEGNVVLVGGPIAGLNRYMDKVDAKVDHIIEEIKEIVRARGIKRVVVDSLNLFTMLVRSDEERRKAVAVLCNALSELKCTSILTSETEEGTMKLSRYGMEEFVVDGVIGLYLIMQGSKFVPGVAIRKMRGTNHDKEIRVYEINDKGIQVYSEEAVFFDGKI